MNKIKKQYWQKSRAGFWHKLAVVMGIKRSPALEAELENCKECIAYERCPSGQRNPITRICYSDEYLAQEYAKVEVKNG